MLESRKIIDAPKEAPPSPANVLFSPHPFTPTQTCQGGTGLAKLETYSAVIATYKGPCPGPCGAIRIVSVNMPKRKIA